MVFAAIPSDPATLLLALFAVFGLPLLVFGLVVLGAGYMQRSADRDLEELEAELDERDGRGTRDADAARDANDEPPETAESDDAGATLNDASDPATDR